MKVLSLVFISLISVSSFADKDVALDYSKTVSEEDFSTVKDYLKSRLDKRQILPKITSCALESRPVYIRFVEEKIINFDWGKFEVRLLTTNEKIGIRNSLNAWAYVYYMETGDVLRNMDVCQALDELGLMPTEEQIKEAKIKADTLTVFLRALVKSQVFRL